MAHDVFISYSSKDKPIADAICANIEASGIRCWIAPRDIAPGEDWPTAITRAISQSRIMVLVFSSSSNSSDDVGREIILAANSKLVIIPFKIENVEPEPGKQYYLARTHWLDAINPPTQGQINILIERVRALIPGQEPQERIPPVTPLPENKPVPEKQSAQRSGVEKAPGKRRARLWPLWLILSLVVLGSATWIGFSGALTGVIKTAVPTRTYMDLSVLTPASTKSSAVDITAISGTWKGTVANGDFQMQMIITVLSNCTLGDICAYFYNATLPCYGDFVYYKMTDGMFEFQGQNEHGCGAAQDFLQPQPDGTLLYISRGDFGETRGSLQFSDNPEFSADFNDPSFDGAFNPGDWFTGQNASLTSIQQSDGAMVFSKQSASGAENVNLATMQVWTLGGIRYIEARLKLDQNHSGENSNVAITFSDQAAGWSGCGIQAGDLNPFLWCGQGSQHGIENMSGSYFLEYDKWYTVRIEFNPQTSEFQGYLDDTFFYSWQPANMGDLLKEKMFLTIGIWADNGNTITAYVDDVRVVK
jgi:hypothetical protein